LEPNPLLGVFFHWLGGLASGSFYVPYRRVRGWAWETYWLVGGFFSWIIVPWILGAVMTRDLLPVLNEAPHYALFWTYTFGVLWGLGGLTFGLTMRYLGMSLGMAVALGYTAAFGTLMPPIFRGQFASEVLGTHSGRIILVGVGICLFGIVFAGAAGMSKEKEMSEEQKRASIKEFDLKKGLLVATFSGVMSACFAYGLAAGDPIKAITIRHGTPPLWQGLPVLVVVLLGGFTTNFIWCVILNVRNHTGRQYFDSRAAQAEQDTLALESVTDAPAEEMAKAGLRSDSAATRAPMLSNYLFSALAGTTWYMQFFFYSMGETQMGRYKFSSWTLHMASIMIFSTLWGIALREWNGTGRRTKLLVALSLLVLIASTMVVGYGNYLGVAGAVTKTAFAAAHRVLH
jgi:L-rhamnose-H+ transport protein